MGCTQSSPVGVEAGDKPSRQHGLKNLQHQNSPGSVQRDVHSIEIPCADTISGTRSSSAGANDSNQGNSSPHHNDSRSRITTNGRQSIQINKTLSPDDITPLRLEDFHIYHQIGKGGFAEVFLARRLFDPWDLVAIKRVEKHRVLRTKAVVEQHRSRLLQQLIMNWQQTGCQGPEPTLTPQQERELRISSTVWTERQIWAMLDGSPYVSPLLHSFQDDSYLFFVVPLLPMGDLAVWLRTYGVMTNNMLQYVAAQIVLALEAMHSVNIVYRDLKPHNLLLDSQGRVQLTDFGLCKQNPDDGNGISDLKGRVGTKGYQSPEIITGAGHSYPVDFYALGITLFRLATDARLLSRPHNPPSPNRHYPPHEVIVLPRTLTCRIAWHDFALLSQLPRTNLDALPPALRQQIFEYRLLSLAIHGKTQLQRMRQNLGNAQRRSNFNPEVTLQLQEEISGYIFELQKAKDLLVANVKECRHHLEERGRDFYSLDVSHDDPTGMSDSIMDEADSSAHPSFLRPVLSQINNTSQLPQLVSKSQSDFSDPSTGGFSNELIRLDESGRNSLGYMQLSESHPGQDMPILPKSNSSHISLQPVSGAGLSIPHDVNVSFGPHNAPDPIRKPSRPAFLKSKKYNKERQQFLASIDLDSLDFVLQVTPTSVHQLPELVHRNDKTGKNELGEDDDTQHEEPISDLLTSPSSLALLTRPAHLLGIDPYNPKTDPRTFGVDTFTRLSDMYNTPHTDLHLGEIPIPGHNYATKLNVYTHFWHDHNDRIIIVDQFGAKLSAVSRWRAYFERIQDGILFDPTFAFEYIPDRRHTNAHHQHHLDPPLGHVLMSQNYIGQFFKQIVKLGATASESVPMKLWNLQRGLLTHMDPMYFLPEDPKSTTSHNVTISYHQNSRDGQIHTENNLKTIGNHFNAIQAFNNPNLCMTTYNQPVQSLAVFNTNAIPGDFIPLDDRSSDHSHHLSNNNQNILPQPSHLRTPHVHHSQQPQSSHNPPLFHSSSHNIHPMHSMTTHLNGVVDKSQPQLSLSQLQLQDLPISEPPKSKQSPFATPYEHQQYYFMATAPPTTTKDQSRVKFQSDAQNATSLLTTAQVIAATQVFLRHWLKNVNSWSNNNQDPTFNAVTPEKKVTLSTVFLDFISQLIEPDPVYRLGTNNRLYHQNSPYMIPCPLEIAYNQQRIVREREKKQYEEWLASKNPKKGIGKSDNIDPYVNVKRGRTSERIEYFDKNFKLAEPLPRNPRLSETTRIFQYEQLGGLQAAHQQIQHHFQQHGNINVEDYLHLLSSAVRHANEGCSKYPPFVVGSSMQQKAQEAAANPVLVPQPAASRGNSPASTNTQPQLPIQSTIGPMGSPHMDLNTVATATGSPTLPNGNYPAIGQVASFQQFQRGMTAVSQNPHQTQCVGQYAFSHANSINLSHNHPIDMSISSLPKTGSGVHVGMNSTSNSYYPHSFSRQHSTHELMLSAPDAHKQYSHYTMTTDGGANTYVSDVMSNVGSVASTQYNHKIALPDQNLTNIVYGAFPTAHGGNNYQINMSITGDSNNVSGPNYMLGQRPNVAMSASSGSAYQFSVPSTSGPDSMPLSVGKYTGNSNIPLQSENPFNHTSSSLYPGFSLHNSRYATGPHQQALIPSNGVMTGYHVAYNQDHVPPCDPMIPPQPNVGNIAANITPQHHVNYLPPQSVNPHIQQQSVQLNDPHPTSSPMLGPSMPQQCIALVSPPLHVQLSNSQPTLSSVQQLAHRPQLIPTQTPLEAQHAHRQHMISLATQHGPFEKYFELPEHYLPYQYVLLPQSEYELQLYRDVHEYNNEVQRHQEQTQSGVAYRRLASAIKGGEYDRTFVEQYAKEYRDQYLIPQDRNPPIPLILPAINPNPHELPFVLPGQSTTFSLTTLSNHGALKYHYDLTMHAVPHSKDDSFKLITGKDEFGRWRGLHHGFLEIKNHPFFAGLDWDALAKGELDSPFYPYINVSGITQHFPKLENIQGMKKGDQSEDVPLSLEEQSLFDGFEYKATLRHGLRTKNMDLEVEVIGERVYNGAVIQNLRLKKNLDKLTEEHQATINKYPELQKTRVFADILKPIASSVNSPSKPYVYQSHHQSQDYLNMRLDTQSNVSHISFHHADQSQQHQRDKNTNHSNIRHLPLLQEANDTHTDIQNVQTRGQSLQPVALNPDSLDVFNSDHSFRALPSVPSVTATFTDSNPRTPTTSTVALTRISSNVEASPAFKSNSESTQTISTYDLYSKTGTVPKDKQLSDHLRLSAANLVISPRQEVEKMPLHAENDDGDDGATFGHGHLSYLNNLAGAEYPQMGTGAGNDHDNGINLLSLISEQPVYDQNQSVFPQLDRYPGAGSDDDDSEEDDVHPYRR